MPIQTPADAMNAFSRTLAIALFMLAPGAAGYYLDKLWGTNVLTVSGFIIGMILGIVLFIFQSKALQAERNRQDKIS